MVTDAAKLRLHYIKSIDSKIDVSIRELRYICVLYAPVLSLFIQVLSILPTDLLYIFWRSPFQCTEVPCGVIVRMNRLLRLPRLTAFFDKTENQTNFPNAFRITKVCFANLCV